MFKRGDKTSCIMVKNRKDYIKEGMAHLSDTKTYKRLDRDYTPDVVQHIRYTIEHKTPMSLRPIVSQVGSATENLTAFLDHYLQPAYLKDSRQFIQEITQLQYNRNDILVMVDVKSLYTCIPNSKGLQACYEERDDRSTTATSRNSQTPA